MAIEGEIDMTCIGGVTVIGKISENVEHIVHRYLDGNPIHSEENDMGILLEESRSIGLLSALWRAGFRGKIEITIDVTGEQINVGP